MISEEFIGIPESADIATPVYKKRDPITSFVSGMRNISTCDPLFHGITNNLSYTKDTVSNSTTL